MKGDWRQCRGRASLVSYALPVDCAMQAQLHVAEVVKVAMKQEVCQGFVYAAVGGDN